MPYPIRCFYRKLPNQSNVPKVIVNRATQSPTLTISVSQASEIVQPSTGTTGQPVRETTKIILEPIDEPTIKLMTSDIAKSIPNDWDDSLAKLDQSDIER